MDSLEWAEAYGRVVLDDWIWDNMKVDSVSYFVSEYCDGLGNTSFIQLCLN
jgi:hypothetical protein